MRDSETICEKQRDKFEDEKERIDELQKTCRGDIQYSMELPEEVNKLRWFVLPQEVAPDPVLEMAS